MNTSPALGRLVAHALPGRVATFMVGASLLLAGGWAVQALSLGGLRGEDVVMALGWGTLAMAPVAWPVAATVVLHDRVASLHREGGWGVLSALGLRRSVWWWAWWKPALGFVAVATLAEHAAGPLGRARLEDLAQMAHLELVPAEGSTRSVGPVALAAREEGGVHVAALGLTGTASAVVATPAGAVAESVRLAGGGLDLRAARVSWRTRTRGGLNLAERTTAELLRAQDVYARWNGVRRSLLPVANLGVLLVAAGLATRWPRLPSALVGLGCAGGMWTVVRALDEGVRAHAVGLGIAAALLVTVPMVLAAWAWNRPGASTS